MPYGSGRLGDGAIHNLISLLQSVRATDRMRGAEYSFVACHDAVGLPAAYAKVRPAVEGRQPWMSGRSGMILPKV